MVPMRGFLVAFIGSASAPTCSIRAGRGSAGTGELQVEFRIGRKGRIECVALRRSSGSELLDRYVLSAVRLAQPFATLRCHPRCR